MEYLGRPNVINLIKGKQQNQGQTERDSADKSRGQNNALKINEGITRQGMSEKARRYIFWSLQKECSPDNT